MRATKIGALLTAWEIINTNKVDDNTKSEIDTVFQQMLKDLLPFKYIGVIHEKNGTAQLGIFQTKEECNEWLKPAINKQLECEIGNGFNLDIGFANDRAKFNVNLSAIKGYTISSDYTTVIFQIA